MKLKCLIYYLKEASILAEKISGKNTSLPILSSVLISAKKRELKITATNLEIGIEIMIPAKIEKEGETAVPARLLCSFLSGFPSNENVSLESSQSNLIISTTNNSTIIKGYHTEDFPLLPSAKEKEGSFSLPAENFLSGINSVYYASSLTEVKPEIASIFISSSKNTPLIFVATDSFRLAKKTVPYSFSDFPPILIPYKNAIEVMRVFENESGDLNIIPNKNQLFISSERVKLVSRLTEGIFPDYEEIIPKTFSTEVTIDKTLLNNALKTASVFSGRLNEVKMEMTQDQKTLKIRSSCGDAGESTTNVPAEVNGEELKITFNHKYIIDGLRFVPSDKLLLKFNGENKPLFITGVKDNSFYYLVMPMKDI